MGLLVGSLLGRREGGRVTPGEKGSGMQVQERMEGSGSSRADIHPLSLSPMLASCSDFTLLLKVSLAHSL